MSNQIIYKRDEDAALWADAKRIAKETGRSLSDIVAECLRRFVEEHDGKPRRIYGQAVAQLPSAAPDPFAARG